MSTDKSSAAIREFAEKWCLKVIEVMKGDDYIMHDLDGCLSDLTALISEHYVEREEHDKVVQQRDELRRIMGYMIRLMEDSEYATVNQQTALQLAKEAIKLTER
jgi:hypothetical protein